MSAAYVNPFGRKGGRGLRPWMLLPKIIAVALYIGTLAGSLTLWLGSDFGSPSEGAEWRLWLLNAVSRLITHLMIPALLAALAFGLTLFLQYPRQFIRMRWLQVKLVTLAILIPSAHFYCSSRMALLRQGEDAGRQFTLGLCITLAISLCVMILGRLKPRLGQNWARSYPCPR